MVPTHMARDEEHAEMVHPNRDKPAVKATRAVVILLLLASIALMVIITIGGWKSLEGAKPIEIAYILLYVVLCVYALRWVRGILPLASALAIGLAIFALVAGPGWFNRDHTGYASAGLPASLLGLLTLVIVPVQILLIAFCMRAMSHGWNVEEERSAQRGERDFGDAQAHPA
jgi:presenilin-like A22 family membrane protease